MWNLVWQNKRHIWWFQLNSAKISILLPHQTNKQKKSHVRKMSKSKHKIQHNWRLKWTINLLKLKPTSQLIYWDTEFPFWTYNWETALSSSIFSDYILFVLKRLIKLLIFGFHIVCQNDQLPLEISKIPEISNILHLITQNILYKLWTRHPKSYEKCFEYFI